MQNVRSKIYNVPTSSVFKYDYMDYITEEAKAP